MSGNHLSPRFRHQKRSPYQSAFQISKLLEIATPRQLQSKFANYGTQTVLPEDIVAVNVGGKDEVSRSTRGQGSEPLRNKNIVQGEDGPIPCTWPKLRAC